MPADGMIAADGNGSSARPLGSSNPSLYQVAHVENGGNVAFWRRDIMSQSADKAMRSSISLTLNAGYVHDRDNKSAIVTLPTH
jgi:hypothetical protein